MKDVRQSCQLTRFRRVTHAFVCLHTHSRHTSNFSRPKKNLIQGRDAFIPFQTPRGQLALRSASVTLFAAQTSLDHLKMSMQLCYTFLLWQKCIAELPTLTVSPCDTRFCMFSHALTPHIQYLTLKSPRRYMALRSASVTLFAAQTSYFPRKSRSNSDSRRVTKRDNCGRNSRRESIAEENLHLQTEQRLGMLMTCGSIKYSLS